MTPDETFLTDAEVERLVGSPRKGRQIAWLADRGLLLEVNLAGRPIVPRSWVDRGKKPAGRRKPNFGAINGPSQN